jgi:hypothetical protein
MVILMMALAAEPPNPLSFLVNSAHSERVKGEYDQQEVRRVVSLLGSGTGNCGCRAIHFVRASGARNLTSRSWRWPAALQHSLQSQPARLQGAPVLGRPPLSEG